ncbi:hypothetical protein DVH05_020082 [Phytophthora capsici]|nr:hypothetical protein DVH05_020082 [Phytophthora capsici]
MPVPDTRTSVDIGDGWTPLSMNVTLKYTKLSCGIAPKSPPGQSGSSLAAARSQMDVLRVLKEERPVVIDTQDSKTYAAALVLAAGRAHLGNIRCLLDRGVSVDAVNFERSTALHAAATVGRFEAV